MQRSTVIAFALAITLAFAVLMYWIDRERNRFPNAPSYVADLMDATSVEWRFDKGQTCALYKIDHPGDPSHQYMFRLSVVSDKGKNQISAIAEPTTLVRIDRAIFHDGTNWTPKHDGARLWLELRIFDKGGNAVFHGVKRSDPFPADADKKELTEEVEAKHSRIILVPGT
ncbi:MAG: hypothetical protein SGJ20_07865 [Planctomycetota bacterium]|nr:hypothetical protein [Planctomycetota bacterium]